MKREEKSREEEEKRREEEEKRREEKKERIRQLGSCKRNTSRSDQTGK